MAFEFLFFVKRLFCETKHTNTLTHTQHLRDCDRENGTHTLSERDTMNCLKILITFTHLNGNVFTLSVRHERDTCDNNHPR